MATKITASSALAIFSAAEANPAHSAMREAGMIEPKYTGGNDGQFCGWKLTERGQVWLDAVLEIPLPERRFVIPLGKHPNTRRADAHGQD